MHLQTAVAVAGRRDEIPRLDRLEQGLGGERLHAFRDARARVTAERVTHYTTGEEDERQAVDDTHDGRDRHDERPVHDADETAEHAKALEGPQTVGDGEAEGL